MKVYLLLDRSGSMVSQWEETLRAINGYVEKLNKKTKVLLATFDSISYDVVRDTTAGAWDPLTSREVEPRSSTPLYDATGRLINRCFEDKPKKAVLVVMTDGYENSSKEFNKHQIKDLVKTAQERGYEMVFLGANFDKIDDETHKIGVEWNRSVYVRPENLYATMTTTLSNKTQAYASATSRGSAAVAMNFSADEKAEAGNLTGENNTIIGGTDSQ